MKNSRLVKVLLILSLFTLLVYGSTSYSFADSPAERFSRTSEVLVYEGQFSRALLRGVTIAELRFTYTPPAAESNGPARLKAEAVSKGMLSRIFGFSFLEVIDSQVQPQSLSLISNKKVDEQGARKRISETILDSESNTLTFTETDPNAPAREPRKVIVNSVKDVYDIIGAVRYLRSQPLKVGQQLSLKVTDSGRVFEIPVKVAEKKKLSTVIGKVNTLRLDPQVFGEGGILPGKGSFSIWVTDDERHVPVKAHIETNIGSIDIKLKSSSANSSATR